jgi:glycosyltransferase involved in cell wall biosynthesis
VRLVIKASGFDESNAIHADLRETVRSLGERVTLVTETLTDNEIKNLVRCCDCFVSLHRSEGFGRGISEAMYLGKPVIATAYSGNLDFMAPDVSMHVGYRLVPVGAGEYPHHEGQVWAEPDLEQAVSHMLWVLDEPRQASEVGARARLHMLKEHSYRPVGLRYRQRIEAVAAGLPARSSAFMETENETKTLLAR